MRNEHTIIPGEVAKNLENFAHTAEIYNTLDARLRKMFLQQLHASSDISVETAFAELPYTLQKEIHKKIETFVN